MTIERLNEQIHVLAEECPKLSSGLQCRKSDANRNWAGICGCATNIGSKFLIHRTF